MKLAHVSVIDMTLKDLLSPLKAIVDWPIDTPYLDKEITHLATHLAEIKFQTMFFAIKGTQFDTHSVIDQLDPQMVTVAVYEDVNFLSKIPQGILGILVPSSRQALALVAHQWAGQPTHDIMLFGVTGTNGKTSVTFMLQHLLQACGYPTACIGTLGHFFNGESFATQNTTPGPIELVRRLKEFKDKGAKAIVMEVSSHALDQYRVDGCHFNGVIFTNLTHDHLDYHQTMERYFLAKSRLFSDFINQSSKPNPLAILNIDDDWIQRLSLDAKAQVLSFGQSQAADIQYQIIKADILRTEVEIIMNGEKQQVKLPIIGAFNVQNFLSSASIMLGLGFEWSTILSSFSSFKGVPGRLQVVTCDKKSLPIVLIDYAHTPDALENILKTIVAIKKQSSNSGLIKILFGCGGDRDAIKRPLMAKIAETYADQVYLTSDNPRSENPQHIIDQIKLGFQKPEQVKIELDRFQAIQKMISGAGGQDILIIAGKGHENYQEIAGVRYPFSDYEVAKQILEA